MYVSIIVCECITVAMVWMAMQWAESNEDIATKHISILNVSVLFEI